MSSVPTGRFAPSPTGPLHDGSLVAAVASWLDARAQGGRWLVRIEDVDHPRCLAGMAEVILGQLAACGLVPDEPPWFQSLRDGAYQAALDRLTETGWAYPCACSRQDIDRALAASGAARPRHQERVYPGTCRNGLHGKPARAMRQRTVDAAGAPIVIDWQDRRLGPQHQNVAHAVGDFVIRRADACWAYQLAVVVDDAAQSVTHVVRGEDLADNTARQILVQRALGLPTPTYLHTPLVRGQDGEKLSKQNGARAVDLSNPLAVLRRAGRVLGLPDLTADTASGWRAEAVAAWAGMMRGPARA